MTIFITSWAFLVIFYTLYIAAIQIYRNWKIVPTWILVLVSPMLLTMLSIDISFQWSIANILFFDFAREATFSERLSRYREQTAYAGTWRNRVATYICTKALNPFDPTKDHC